METDVTKKIIIIVILLAIVGVLGFLYAKKEKTTSNDTVIETPVVDTVPKEKELSQAERREIVDAVLSKAADTMTVDISSCKPFPEVAQFPLNSIVQFTNQDAVDHVISFSPTHIFTIPQKGSFPINFSFYKFPGIRKYTCDSKPAGTVSLTK